MVGEKVRIFLLRTIKRKYLKSFFSGKSFSLNSLILCESTGSADYRLFKTLFSGEKWVQWGRRVKKNTEKSSHKHCSHKRGLTLT